MNKIYIVTCVSIDYDGDAPPIPFDIKHVLFHSLNDAKLGVVNEINTEIDEWNHDYDMDDSPMDESHWTIDDLKWENFNTRSIYTWCNWNQFKYFITQYNQPQQSNDVFVLYVGDELIGKRIQPNYYQSLNDVIIDLNDGWNTKLSIDDFVECDDGMDGYIIDYGINKKICNGMDIEIHKLCPQQSNNGEHNE